MVLPPSADPPGGAFSNGVDAQARYWLLVSQQNLELASMWFDAFNRRDAATLIGLVDAHFEWETSLTPVQGGTIRGASGIADFFEQLDDVWEELTVTVDDLEAVGERVVISGRWCGRGRSSGATVDQPSAWVMHMRNGRMLWSGALQPAWKRARPLRVDVTLHLSFIFGAFGAQGLAVDSAHIYWTTSSPSGHRIGRANLDGSAPNQSLTSPSRPRSSRRAGPRSRAPLQPAAASSCGSRGPMLGSTPGAHAARVYSSV